MDNNWKSIFTTGTLYLAEIVKNILEDNEIEAVLLNKQDSLYLFGDIEVYVKADDVIRAKFLIKEF
ncbi:MAG: DUF2007 domain-containing protein [Salinivirgaceae bacterium]|nr:DUF2007 domain-containing protein [Salinivirgaceae bacterium]